MSHTPAQLKREMRCMLVWIVHHLRMAPKECVAVDMTHFLRVCDPAAVSSVTWALRYRDFLVGPHGTTWWVQPKAYATA